MDLATSEHNITRSDNLTFTRFAELPKEIRLLIWDASVPGPRIVNIRQRYLTKTWDDIINEQGTKRRGAPTKAAGNKGDALEAHRLKGLKSDCPQPSILFACRESYTVASKYYQRAFHPADTIPETYFDFHRDTLFLRYDTMCADSIGHEAIVNGIAGNTDRVYDRDNIARVENLAVLVDPKDGSGLESWICYLMAIFLGVKKLTLVLQHYTSPGDDDSDLSLIEPIDVNQACDIYRSLSILPRELVPSIPENANIAKSEVDMDRLKQYRAEDLVFLDDHWSIPHINRRISITGCYKRELDLLRQSLKNENWEEKIRYYQS
jgi:hypothetical protein